MTLRKQLFLTLSLLFLIVLAGLLLLNVKGTRDYLEAQLGSHAQDAATSLSLRLAQVMGRNDPVLTQLQVDTVFDRGYFQKVVLVDPRGEVLLSRELSAKVGEVPLWFSSAFALNPPGGEAFVSSGWQQLGKVVVSSQPAHAYAYLWSSSKELAAWIGAVFLLALALTHGLLKVILNPLGAIERTAKAIQDKRFEQIEHRPRARELARVVRAMNEMSRRIADIINAEVARAEGFRQQLMRDEVTGADNRNSFELRFEALLNNPDAELHGHVIAVELNGLKQFNQEVGYREGDALLRGIVERGTQLLRQPGALVARLNGGLIAFVSVHHDPAQATRIAQGLRENLATWLDVKDREQRLAFSMGVVPFGREDRKGDVLARLDMVIEAARLKGRNQLAFATAADTGQLADALGSMGWRELIEKALAEKRWELLVQKVLRFDSGQVVHWEAMARLRDQQGELVPASQFIPMATRHRLMPWVDRAVLTLVRNALRERPALEGLAVNLSAQSVSDPSFMGWLARYLKDLGPDAQRLSVELTCYGCSQNLDAARALAKALRLVGAKFGIDRMGMDPMAPQVLVEVPPDYIKLESAPIFTAVGEAKAAEWMRSIHALARSLDAQVMAQGVETQAEYDWLRPTHDAAQGYLIARLETLPPAA